MWRKPKSGTHREQSQLPQPCCPPIPKRGKAACHLNRGPRTSVRLNAAPARPPRWIVVSVRLTARDEPRSSTSRSHSNRPPAPSLQVEIHLREITQGPTHLARIGFFSYRQGAPIKPFRLLKQLTPRDGWFYAPGSNCDNHAKVVQRHSTQAGNINVVASRLT